MRSISLAEQETIIRWDAEERVAYIDSATPAVIRKLDKLAEDHPDTYKCVSENKKYYAKKYRVPASFIRFGKPATEARKAAGKERARANFSRIQP